MTYATVIQEIRDGAVIVIDGATGTGLERRGAPMHGGGAWCALATESHPDTRRQIHADYIRAGSRVVTANTLRDNPRGAGAPGVRRQVRASQPPRG